MTRHRTSSQGTGLLVSTLQVSPEDARTGAGAGGGPPQSSRADTIRAMLRAQQRECAVLHSHPLFRELRGKCRGGAVPALSDAPPPPPVLDLDAEGRGRLAALIHSAAMAREKEPAGVWASFGSSYVCLGRPEEVHHCPQCCCTALCNLPSTHTCMCAGHMQY
jgi:hypothetical protein